MKNLLVLIAAVAALTSCSDVESGRKYRESLKYKKVRAQMMSCYAGHCVVGRTVSIIEVDTMYHPTDTISHGNYMYVIVK
jgi:hypothetical protein